MAISRSGLLIGALLVLVGAAATAGAAGAAPTVDRPARSLAFNPAGQSQGSVAINADGRFEVLTPAPDGTVYTLFQHEIGLGWSSPQPFPHPPGSRTTHPVALVTNDDGRLEAAWLGEDGRGHVTRQRPGRDGWTGISPLEPADVQLASPPTFGHNDDDRLELFAVTTGGVLVNAYQETPGGVWSGWHVLDDTHSWATDIEGAVSASTDGYDGSIQVVARGSDGLLRQAAQLIVYEVGDDGLARPKAIGWLPFTEMGVAAKGRPTLRMASVVNGIGPHAYYRDPQDHLVMAYPMSPTTAEVIDDVVPVASAPSSFLNLDTRREVFVAGADGVLHHTFQWPTLDGGFVPLLSMGMPCTQAPTALRNLDGRLEVFCVGPDGTLWHDFQTTPGGGWFGPTALQGRFASGP